MNESEIDLDNLPLAEALSFADEGSTTGGLLTHAALKTLAAGCRELTAARAEIERLDTAGIHSCHNDCQRLPCVLRRERDEARAELAELKLRAIEQRDGLRSGIDYASDQLHKVNEHKIAREALAAVEGGSDE
jgi:hypothetical protein